MMLLVPIFNECFTVQLIGICSFGFFDFAITEPGLLFDGLLGPKQQKLVFTELLLDLYFRERLVDNLCDTLIRRTPSRPLRHTGLRWQCELSKLLLIPHGEFIHKFIHRHQLVHVSLRLLLSILLLISSFTGHHWWFLMQGCLFQEE